MQIAFFDLDGTITRRDSLTPYLLHWLRQHPQRAPRLLTVLPALARFGLWRDHGDLKSALIRAVLGGVERSDIAAWNASYLPVLLRDGLFAQALEAIAHHRSAGHRLILMSASVDFYVPDIGKALGFDETLCTRVRWSGTRLDGALASTNCRGEEKKRLLETVRAANPSCVIHAYGNSPPDLPHLRAADHGVLVNAPGAVVRRAMADGIDCRAWR